MIETISFIGLFASVVVPWLVGAIWLRLMIARSGTCNAYIVLGQGYLFGIILTIFLMILWDLAGMRLEFWPMAAALLGFGILGVVLQRKSLRLVKSSYAAVQLSKSKVALIFLIISMIIFRLWAISHEVLVRPLYPWDAWMNWSPKALVWFHFRDLVPFVGPEKWLEQGVDSNMFTFGAWKYPLGVPLINLWSMLGSGISDHPLNNLPWFILLISMSFAIFGYLISRGTCLLLAVAGAYLLVSVPYINVHTSLAGYADFWLATAFGLGTMSIMTWQDNRHWAFVALTLFYAVACALLKIPGLVLGSILLLTLTLATPLGPKILKILICMCVIGAVVVLVSDGLSFELPRFGRFLISKNEISIPVLGTVQVGYQAITETLIIVLFSMMNWNILWYIFLFAVVLTLLKSEGQSEPQADLSCSILLILFLAVIFMFTGYGRFAEDFTTINRALMYCVIPILIFSLRKYSEFSCRR